MRREQAERMVVIQMTARGRPRLCSFLRDWAMQNSRNAISSTTLEVLNDFSTVSGGDVSALFSFP